MIRIILLFFISTSVLMGQTQIGQDIDGEAAGNLSGFSVSSSADGQRVAIGATGNRSFRGHVRIYQFNSSGNWQQLGQDIDGEAVDDRSGTSVSLSANGQRVAVGATLNDGNGSNAGHVRVYQLNQSGNWQQLGQDIDGEAVDDRSGTSVSLSADGQRIAIGAIFNDGGGANSGHVRIYRLNASGSWQQIGQDIDGEQFGDQSGFSVSISADGERVAVGANQNDGNGGNSGHVRIYGLNALSSWQQIGQDIDGEAAVDLSGWSVSLSADGERVAIGARFNDGTATSAGHVRIYGSNASGNWQQIGQDIDGEAAFDQSGWSVSLSADGLRVAIGAIENQGRGPSAGHVRIYDLNASGNWEKIGSDIDAEQRGDGAGHSVSLSADGLQIAIGAIGNDDGGSNAGQVRVYALEAVTLPIELLSFTATSRAGTHVLTWTTATETDNDYFTVEHSTDARDWYELTTLSGAGTSVSSLHYDYVHTNPSVGPNYYRLRQTDFDGTSSISDIILLFSAGKETADLLVYPNPVTNGWLSVVVPETYRISQLELLSLDGRVVATYPESDMRIHLPGVPAGLYVVRVSGEQGVLHTSVTVGASR